MHLLKLSAVLLVLLALAFSAGPAGAETVGCQPITSVPVVITVQGIYCFTGHLNTAQTHGAAIEIATNNVILDLNGFKLGGLAAGSATNAIGVYANNRQNITIKNGTIRGFAWGIHLVDQGVSQGHVIEDIRADLNTYTGIDVRGSGHIIRNNQVVTTGGSTALTSSGVAYGIFAAGTGIRVLNNDVINTFHSGAGSAWAISLRGAVSSLAVNNRITEADTGIDNGIQLTGANKYRDNLTSAVITPYVGGTDAGNNH